MGKNITVIKMLIALSDYGVFKLNSSDWSFEFYSEFYGVTDATKLTMSKHSQLWEFLLIVILSFDTGVNDFFDKIIKKHR